MNLEDELLSFILPEGLQFPEIVRNPATGKVRHHKMPFAQIQAANPNIDWGKKGHDPDLRHGLV